MEWGNPILGVLDFSIEGIDLGLKYFSLFFIGLYFIIECLYALPVSFVGLLFLGAWQ